MQGTFGQRMRKRRKALGMHQDELAEKAGLIRYQMVSLYENGKCLPRLDTFIAICNALHCRPEELADFAECGEEVLQDGT